ncbi:MAG: RlmE family RNA methyltransferase [Spirochaetales bacterium]|nr:RlmE family RNA methyltransferase [Spirochaetales bacterium]
MAASTYEKPDAWSIKAKKEGYPARSVYKLEEIDKKFNILKPGYRILDIGAAPGSWSLWVLRRLGAAGFLAAVDLQPLGIHPAQDNFFFWQGNLYDETTRVAIAERGPYHVVLSDAAPATSGNSGLDTDRSEAIVEAVLDYADAMLKTGGSVIVKLFMGGGQRDILDRMKASYTTARAYKPAACRSVSFETYLIGLGKKPAAPRA